MKSILKALVLLLSCISAPTFASVIYLSDYLGVESGEVTYESNNPYMNIVVSNNAGIGADVPGTFDSGIDFRDRGAFEKGIGMHVAPDRLARIEFNLDTIRAGVMTFDTFSSFVGIDASAGPYGNGAKFNVYLDGVLADSKTVIRESLGSQYMELDVSTTSILGLELDIMGMDYWSNHTAWADAKITYTVPEASLTMLFSLGLISLAGFGHISRKRS